MMDAAIAEELPEPMKKFYKREPLALGITQILLGIETIMFGVLLTLDYNKHHFDFKHEMTSNLTGVLYIISGSLLVAAAKIPKPFLLKIMVTMNMVSAMASGAAIVIFSLDLLCCNDVRVPEKIILVVTVVLLLFSVLQSCISISSAAIGFNAIDIQTSNNTVAVAYQNVSPDNDVAPSPQQRPRMS